MNVTNNQVGYILPQAGYISSYTIENALHVPDQYIPTAEDPYLQRFKLGILDSTGIEYTGKLAYDTVNITNVILSGAEYFDENPGADESPALTFNKGDYLVMFTYGSYLDSSGEHINISRFTGNLSVSVKASFYR
jgi:hypothetical protein